MAQGVSEREKRRSSYIIAYTAFFALVSLAVFSTFLAEGKTMICRTDGESQYFVYLRYMGQYLRKVLSGILQGDFHLPQYDFSIGMGDDINAIVRFHPLEFLSVFVPAAYTEQLYSVITLLRMYLAGLSFSAYAFYWRKKYPVSGINVLTGSLLYVFCGHMLVRALNHPTYAAPFIVLPLLLLGAEKSMNREGDLLFPAAVLLGFWSNYYFMYICSIALLACCLLRFPEICKEDRLRQFPKFAGRLIGLYLIGLFCSLLTFLPAALRYRSSARVSQMGTMKSLFYYSDIRRYGSWFLNLISPYKSSGNGLMMGYAVTALPAVCLILASASGRFRTLKRCLLLDLAALLMPLFGYVFAGMNNENSRWVFLIALPLGMCCVFGIDQIAQLSDRQKHLTAAVSGLFLAGVCAECLLFGPDLYTIAGAAELILCEAVLFGMAKRHASVKSIETAALAITALSIAVSGLMTYSPSFGALAADYTDRGEADRLYQTCRMSAAADLDDPSFYRVDTADLSHSLENCGEYLDLNGTSIYNSIVNSSLISSALADDQVGLDGLTQFHDLDGRPVSLNLAHVKYFVCRRDNTGMVPYGFSEKPVLSEGYFDVYENEHLLPAGFACTSFMTSAAYEKLSGPEKEMAKLQAVILSGSSPAEEEQLREAGLTEIKDPDSEVTADTISLPDKGDGMERSPDGYSASEGGGSVSFSVKLKAGCQTYLKLEGLVSSRAWDCVQVSTEDTLRTITLRNENETYNIGRQDYLINLGYSGRDREKQVTLTFPLSGSRELDGIETIAVSLQGFDEKLSSLGENALEDAEFTDGKITGKAECSQPAVLVFPVLAQEGWSLECDGEKADLITVDGCYLAAILDAGSHVLCLEYRTPGLQAGAVGAGAGLAAFIMLAFCGRKRRKESSGV